MAFSHPVCRRLATACLVAGFALSCATVTPPPATPPSGAGPALVLLGEVNLPSHRRFDGLEIGGLSGLTATDVPGEYLAVSDARGGGQGPPRVLRLRIDPADGSLEPGDVTPLAWIELRASDGGELPLADVDPEGIALAPDGSFWVSSEGNVADGEAPFVARFAPNGRERERLPLPTAVLPATGRGVRHNLALEGLVYDEEHGRLLVAVEGPLVQDGPEADAAAGSVNRIYAWDVEGTRWSAAWPYPVEPVHGRPPLGGFRVSGVTDLMPLGDDRFLVLERSFGFGIGMAVRLFRVSFEGADDVLGTKSLAALAPRTARKELVLDLRTLPIRHENVEGIAPGPRLADGRRTVILISDNNFADDQMTQVLAFAW